MKEIQKWNSRLEKFWFMIAIVSTLGSLVIGFIDEFQGVSAYFLLSLMAWGIFFIRRGLRKRFEKNN
jgi:hypothetical protein